MSGGLSGQLGPLAPLAGVWEGDQGVDIAPARPGVRETRYRERISFEPFGPVTNGPRQTLFGLRYAATAWPIDESEPFHEETGYWLWDAERNLVMRCFMVPRGVTVLAGGEATANATEWRMHAQAGDTVFGILSNPFLDQAFRTLRYDVHVRLEPDGRFSYEENTQLRMPDQTDVFHHRDSNTLRRTEAA